MFGRNDSVIRLARRERASLSFIGVEESMNRFEVERTTLAFGVRPVRAILTRPRDRIQFAESRFALGRGAREGVYPRRYSTDQATKLQGKTASARRGAALLAYGV